VLQSLHQDGAIMASLPSPAAATIAAFVNRNGDNHDLATITPS